MARRITAFSTLESPRERGISKVWVTFDQDGKDYTVEIPYTVKVDMQDKQQMADIAFFVNNLNDREIDILKMRQ